MKELVSFSLRRRFMNNASLLLNILLCGIVCCVLFADKIIEVINPSMLEDQIIYMQLDPYLEASLSQLNQSGIQFLHDETEKEELIEKHPKSYVLYYDQGYKLMSQFPIQKEILQSIQSVLQNIHHQLTLNDFLTIEEQKVLNTTMELENVATHQKDQLNSDKQNLVFMVITSIYFTMLSFSTSVANEVIYEKSTRQLELILTSVSAKTHFLSKMLSGWLAIMAQALILGCFVIIALVFRNLYDEGRGLIQLIQRLQLMQFEQETLGGILGSLTFEWEFICKILFIFFFLMMGILLLQMVLVIISSFIANIEEAGNVQGPFYLILLVVYYFAISVNTPYQMSEGIGFICSFLPFLNMLFMPCRLLIQNVSILELSLSALISSLFMGLILTKGPKIYQRGVLDYSSKGFLGVMKKTIEREKIYEKK